MRTLVVIASASAAAAGCTGRLAKDLAPGQQTERSFQQTDPDARLGQYEREYLITIPEGYTGKERVPVIWYFHGWGASWRQDTWTDVANANNVIVLNPKGMADGQYGSPSFNVGHAGRTDVCKARDVTDLTEYTSCKTTKQTGPCNCFTCYDDVQFVNDLAQSLEDELCIDSNQHFASGASNGAMFLYYLVPELAERSLPLRIRAIAPWYGAFMVGMEEVPVSVAGTSVFHFHGNLDTEIPPKGGESDDGFLYIPVHETLSDYAKVKGCNAVTQAISTPYDSLGNRTHSCVEHSGCTQGRVVRCNFQAQHGFWTPYAEEMSWWFFSSVVAAANSTTLSV
jgi:poly(3-hydroxybutyrate) depolymerase